MVSQGQACLSTLQVNRSGSSSTRRCFVCVSDMVHPRRWRSPDVVVYEDFARDPSPTIEHLAGVPAPDAPLLRQSGARSLEWTTRYLEDAA